MQSFIGRHLHLSLLLVTEAWPLDLQLPVRQRHTAFLRSMPTNLPAGLAGRTHAGHLLGAQHEDGFDGLSADGLNDVIDGDPGLGDQFQQRQQQLPVGFGEVFEMGGGVFLVPADDVIRFFHGGGVLSKDGFGESILSNRLRHRCLTFN